MGRALEIDDDRVDQKSAGSGEGSGGAFQGEPDVRGELAGIGNDCEGEHRDGDDGTIKKYLLTGEELDGDEQTQHETESHRATRLPEEDEVDQICGQRREEHPSEVEIGERIRLQQRRGKSVDESADERHGSAHLVAADHEVERQRRDNGGGDAGDVHRSDRRREFGDRREEERFEQHAGVGQDVDTVWSKHVSAHEGIRVMGDGKRKPSHEPDPLAHVADVYLVHVGRHPSGHQVLPAEQR